MARGSWFVDRVWPNVVSGLIVAALVGFAAVLIVPNLFPQLLRPVDVDVFIDHPYLIFSQDSTSPYKDLSELKITLQNYGGTMANNIQISVWGDPEGYLSVSALDESAFRCFKAPQSGGGSLCTSKNIDLTSEVGPQDFNLLLVIAKPISSNESPNPEIKFTVTVSCDNCFRDLLSEKTYVYEYDYYFEALKFTKAE